MLLADTHCHLDLHQFDDDRAEALQRAWSAGVAKILIPGLDLESSRSALALARTHPALYAAVGFHPTDIEKWDDTSKETLRHLARSAEKKIVAVGEIGLDYYWVRESEKRARQRQILQEQLNLAEELNKPVIIHLREQDNADAGEASRDILKIIGEWRQGLQTRKHPLAERPGVFHSFGGNLELAKEVMALDFYIGVTGPVTFKNAPERQALVSSLPLERLLTETDAPFLAPQPHRGKRNEPSFVREIADKIAQLHSRNQSEVAAITNGNAARLFGWGD